MQSTKNKVVLLPTYQSYYFVMHSLWSIKKTIFFLILKEVNVKYIISNCIFDIFLFLYSFNKILVKYNINPFIFLSVRRLSIITEILQRLIIVRRDHILIYVSIVPEITLNCNTSYQDKNVKII